MVVKSIVLSACIVPGRGGNVVRTRPGIKLINSISVFLVLILANSWTSIWGEIQGEKLIRNCQGLHSRVCARGCKLEECRFARFNSYSVGRYIDCTIENVYLFTEFDCILVYICVAEDERYIGRKRGRIRGRTRKQETNGCGLNDGLLLGQTAPEICDSCKRPRQV